MTFGKGFYFIRSPRGEFALESAKSHLSEIIGNKRLRDFVTEQT